MSYCLQKIVKLSRMKRRGWQIKGVKDTLKYSTFAYILMEKWKTIQPGIDSKLNSAVIWIVQWTHLVRKKKKITNKHINWYSVIVSDLTSCGQRIWQSVDQKYERQIAELGDFFLVLLKMSKDTDQLVLWSLQDWLYCLKDSVYTLTK